MKKIIMTVLLCFSVYAGYAEKIKGSIVEIKDGQKNALPFANVFWEGTTIGTSTDIKGDFELEIPTNLLELRLIASFIGYTNDTVAIEHGQQTVIIEMKETARKLAGVEITERQSGSYISSTSLLKTEVISSLGLCQLACCNLAESFESSATVDVGYADAVSGARQIQMLGLAGVYSQLMYENVPFLRGLSAPFGLNYIPGSFMESIQISKGTSSVVNGFEAITGQINVEYRKPQKADPFFINLYGSSDLKSEANAIGNIRINERLGTTIFGHGSYFNNAMDHVGHDNFMDQPKTRQINLVNRWSYDSPNYRNVTTISFVDDNRIGGQMNFDPDRDKGSDSIYGFNNHTQRAQFFTKNGFIIDSTCNIGTQLSATYLDLNSYYGRTTYDGIESNVYANFIFEKSFSKQHKIITGLSFQYNDISETYDKMKDHRIESIPGIFGQYTWAPNSKFVAIAGIRYDYNSYFDQSMITPRFHLKWQALDFVMLRGSVGKGYRTTNILAENMGLMASSRTFHIAEVLKQEEAWNYGVNAVIDIPYIDGNSITLSLDAYRTDFKHQVVTDIDRSANDVYFYNLDGKSYANSFQAEILWPVFKRYNLTLAARYNDVQQTVNGELRSKPYTSNWKGILVQSYSTKFDKWRFDCTLQLNGKSRLPNTAGLRPDYSDPYLMLHAQITKNFKHLSVYVGVENLTNYTQPNPIINYETPFERGFDASVIWGPLMGRTFYAGLRWTIN